jgi:hypothetical protein
MSVKSLTAAEINTAIVVENAINNFFTESKTLTYKKIDPDFTSTNLKLIIKYIKYLNNQIKRNKITLTDVNFKKKGKITEIIYDDETRKIKYKYQNGGDTEYSAQLQVFIKNIYIYNDNDIFFLIPLKFRKTNTPNYNSIEITKVAVETLLPTLSVQSFEVPQSRTRLSHGLMSTFSTNALERKTLKRKAPSSKSSSSTLKPLSSLNLHEQTLALNKSDYNIRVMTDVAKILSELKKTDKFDINEYIKIPKLLDIQKANLMTKGKRKTAKLASIEKYYKHIIEIFNKKQKLQESLVKKQKLQESSVKGGNNIKIKIIRKVYTDNKYRKYIKYNKNTIIYLKD